MTSTFENQQIRRMDRPESEFTDKVVEIKRVSKKTKGGNQISFTALVVSGDKKSRVGVGHSRAKSVADAIQKAIQSAVDLLPRWVVESNWQQIIQILHSQSIGGV